MEELKEKIARAINTANGLDQGLSHEEMLDLERDYGPSWSDWMPEVNAALRAIEEAGFAVVPKDHAANHMQQLAEIAGYATFELENATEMRDTAFSLIKKIATRHLEEPRG